MELSDLRTIVSVVEKGSVSLAAKDLHRVPSGVTTRIRQLEDSLGVPLFAREKMRLQVTHKGRELYAYARRILELVEEAENRVRSGEPGGKFRIGSMDSTAAARLPRPLAALHAAHPRVELELTTGTSRFLYDLLLDNRLDAIFIADPKADERLECLPVFEEELALIAPAGHKPVHEPDDIASGTLLAFKEGCSYRNRLLSWFRSYGLEPARIADLTSYHAIMGGVAAGMGFGVVPDAVLRLFPDRRTLSVTPLEHSLGKVTTELVWRKGVLSATMTALRACLKQARKNW
jgi:DNA-binding transcriptional LysR family regulator